MSSDKNELNRLRLKPFLKPLSEETNHSICFFQASKDACFLSLNNGLIS